MYAEISAAIKSAEVFLEIVKAAKSLSNYNEFVSAVSEVNTKLLHTLTAALAGKEKEAALSNRIRELEEEIARHENWERTAKNYTLQNVGGDHFAYVYKPVVESNQPRHWACAKCFQERKLCILQCHRPPAYICPSCSTKIEPYKNGGLVRIDAVYE